MSKQSDEVGNLSAELFGPYWVRERSDRWREVSEVPSNPQHELERLRRRQRVLRRAGASWRREANQVCASPKRFGSQKLLVHRHTPPTGLSDFDKGVVNVGNSNDPPGAKAQRTREAARVEQ